MLIKYNEFKFRLKKGLHEQVYLFTGEEIYLIEEAITALCSCLLTKEEQEANVHTFYADDFTWDNFIALARSFPFIGQNRLILVKNLEKMPKEEAPRLAKFLQKKHSYLYIVLVAEKIDLKTKTWGFINDHGLIVQFYKLFENKVPSWIMERVRENGRTISSSLAQTLVQMLGNDLSLINRELDKIYLSMGEEKQIRQEHLSVVSGEARIFSIFDLVRNLGEKKGESSLRILDRLLDEGAYPVLLLTMMVRQFRHILVAKSLMEKGRGEAEIARATGVSPFFCRPIMEQAKIFDSDQLQILYQGFLDLDLQLKSSSVDHGLLLENFIIRMCRIDRQTKKD